VNLLLITLAVLAFAVSVGLIERRWERDERERSARRWEQRERLLDGRKPTPSHREVLERRSRRS
jgi:hypothetical protein